MNLPIYNTNILEIYLYDLILSLKFPGGWIHHISKTTNVEKREGVNCVFVL